MSESASGAQQLPHLSWHLTSVPLTVGTAPTNTSLAHTEPTKHNNRPNPPKSTSTHQATPPAPTKPPASTHLQVWGVLVVCHARATHQGRPTPPAVNLIHLHMPLLYLLWRFRGQLR